MKIQELRNLTEEELHKKEVELKKELFQLNYERQMGRVEKPAQFGAIRRTIARILTILNEKERKSHGTKNK